MATSLSWTETCRNRVDSRVFWVRMSFRPWWRSIGHSQAYRHKRRIDAAAGTVGLILDLLLLTKSVHGLDSRFKHLARFWARNTLVQLWKDQRNWLENISVMARDLARGMLGPI